MKKTIYMFTFLFLILLLSCKKDDDSDNKIRDCEKNYSKHPKNEKYQAILDKYTAQGLTGLTVTVHTSKGIWTGSSGYSRVEDTVNMTACAPQYSASIQKTLTAVITLQLISEGKLQFDTKIEKFLSEEIKEYVWNYDKITVEHLLMHTSGLHDILDGKFIDDLFTNPMASFTSEQLLSYVKETGPVDLPGVKHYYSDANYILLSIIIDSITGSHVKAVEERILNPLGLESSSYHNKNYPHPDGLVDSYWESPIDGNFENISDIQNHLNTQIFGADGLLTTTTDLDKFINALFKGKLLSNEMKNKLKTIKVKNENTNWINDNYGYGVMFLPDEDHGEWIGHSGTHVGAAAYVYYNPANDVSISAMTNMGTIFSEKYTVMFYYDLFVELVGVTFE